MPCQHLVRRAMCVERQCEAPSRMIRVAGVLNLFTNMWVQSTAKIIHCMFQTSSCAPDEMEAKYLDARVYRAVICNIFCASETVCNHVEGCCSQASLWWNGRRNESDCLKQRSGPELERGAPVHRSGVITACDALFSMDN